MVQRESSSYYLILTTALLTAIGLIFIYSASSISAGQRYDDMFYFVKRQSIAICLGVFSCLVLYRFPMKFWYKTSFWFYLLSIALLAATFIPGIGRTVNGATRWISFAGFSFQPAELTKLTMILLTAKNLSRPKFSGLDNNWALIGCFLPILPAAILLMIQPDFGSTFLICCLVFSMLFVSGLKWRIVSGLGVLAVSLVIGAVIAAPYRMARLTSFLNPWDHAQGSGFQIIQSYLGFFNGGWFGLGIGSSVQKLYFLPEAHTDFILSVIGEELGLAGILLIIAIFTYLLFLCISIAERASTLFTRLLCFGLTVWLALQTILNMGVAMGLLPTKGMTLPFISHGSSSLILCFWAITLIVRINQEDIGAGKRHT